MLDIATNLKQLRLDKGIEIPRIAKWLNVQERTYKRYEDGTRTPDIETLYKISDLFCVTVDDLVRYIDKNTGSVDRSLVLSYKDLVELGLHPRLAHGLIAEVYSQYAYDNVSGDKKIKYVYKKDIKVLLENLVKTLDNLSLDT